eukprot:TRINITY_DN6374_c0_g1_i1.p1 TRINITY_DN6374_c0_g1~~TRINITY_DN6374_c0_g1_i1.p1  ORF type:complete len:106 (-),score=19.25 TRINITY_DN6374_c0_g1_i1:162-479(-)
MGEFSLQYCIQVILNEDFQHILPFECTMCLSIVSKSIHNTVKPSIEKNYWFNLSSTKKRIVHYLPRRILDIVNIRQLTFEPTETNDSIKQRYLNNITHLKFHMFF